MLCNCGWIGENTFDSFCPKCGGELTERMDWLRYIEMIEAQKRSIIDIQNIKTENQKLNELRKYILKYAGLLTINIDFCPVNLAEVSIINIKPGKGYNGKNLYRAFGKDAVEALLKCFKKEEELNQK